jgi:Raf kinase inhibitor-like YbhB/YbcL family protein
MTARGLLLFALLGCGDDSGGGTADGPPGGADGPGAADGAGADGSGADGPGAADAGAFTLTSTVITPGALFPDDYTCDGIDMSPALTWSGGPSETQSYAVVLRDLDFMSGFIHWVIWDIPAGTTALPEDVDKTANPGDPAGAKQCRSFDGATFGYLGPCSPSSVNTYEFTVYALDVAELPNVTTNSTRAAVVAEILMHDVASTTLAGEH